MHGRRQQKWTVSRAVTVSYCLGRYRTTTSSRRRTRRSLSFVASSPDWDRLNDRKYLNSRLIMLLNRERLMWLGVGVAAALLLGGGGLGIKAIYDAAHRPEMPMTRANTERIFVPVPYAVTPSPSPSGSPSPTPSPGPTSRPGSALVSTGVIPPVPSPSLPVKVKHCPPPPDVPPRCLPVPTPSLPQI